jgi:predicted MFS family arabinose efflux permease
MPGAVILPLLALTLGHVFSNAVRTLPAVSADLLGRDLGLSADGLAALTGAYPAAFAAAMIPVGVALDRYGVRVTALALLAIGVVGSALAALAGGPAGMLLAQAVLGIGCSGMMMAPMTFAATRMDAPRFTLWSGLVQGIGNSGMLLSASPLAWLIERDGWRAGFWAAGGLALLAMVAVALTVPHVRPATMRRTLRQDAMETLAIFASPALRPLLVFALASFGVVFGLRGLWGGPWLMEMKGLSRIEAGNVLFAMTIALVIAPGLAGGIARAVGRPVALLAGSHFVVAGLIFALLAGHALPVWFDTMVLVAFGLIIAFQVLAFSLAREAVPPERTGRALSSLNIAFFGGAAVLQMLSGLAAARGGVGAAIATLGIALLGCTAGFLWLRRRRR